MMPKYKRIDPPAGFVFVKVTSHRAFDRLKSIEAEFETGPLQEYFSFLRSYHGVLLPVDAVAEAVKIPGIDRAPFGDDLMQTWNWKN